jgi:hypothetical protein
MITLFKKLLRPNKVRWVKNTEVKHKHIEANRYLLVHDQDDIPMLFTEYQVIQAKKRALKNLEDTDWE